MDDSPYAEHHRRQEAAIRDAPPYPAERYAGRGIVMAAGGPRRVTNAWVTLNVGQMVLGKARCWSALQLTMHLSAWSDFYYQYVYGDKETFHLAWRMLDRPYGMRSRLPRKAIGHWSRAPASDGGAWTLFQHDLAGREVFHHRTSTGKWSLLGENLSFAGFPFDPFCRETLAELARQWDGRVRPPPAPSRLARTEAEIVAASPFRYVRRATDERTLQLLGDGRVGEGAAAAERVWRLVRDQDGPVLLLEGDYGVICRLRLGDDGVWRGRWLQFEQMPIELIPLG